MNTENSNKVITYENPKSEEVQAIIDRMPIHWAGVVAVFVGIFISIVILLGFLIKYPDTVDGQITITGNVAPVRLVANSNGRIQLLQHNKAILCSGDVISYIESGADYKDILFIDSMLNNLDVSRTVEFPLPDSLLLGDVSSAYNRFLLSYLQYNRVLTSDIYVTMRKNLEHKIASDEDIIKNIDAELTLKDVILKNAKFRTPGIDRNAHTDRGFAVLQQLGLLDKKQNIQFGVRERFTHSFFVCKVKHYAPLNSYAKHCESTNKNPCGGFFGGLRGGLSVRGFCSTSCSSGEVPQTAQNPVWSKKKNLRNRLIF